jgi:hypothetical protein
MEHKINPYAIIITAVAFFIIGFVVSWLIWGRGTLPNGSVGVTDERTNSNVSSLAFIVDGNAIAVSNQPAGSAVAVSFVTLAQDGWVVIHEDREGKPGNILGAKRFPAGEYPEGGAVSLLRGTEKDGIYYAMLHYGDGDREFDFTKDLPITDEDGNVILMKFKAISNTEEN